MAIFNSIWFILLEGRTVRGPASTCPKNYRVLKLLSVFQILKLKISNLENTIERNEAKATIEADSVQVDVVRSAKEEIDEIQSILPEISAKIEDAKESMREGAHLPKEAIINEMLNRNPEVSPEKRVSSCDALSSRRLVSFLS